MSAAPAFLPIKVNNGQAIDKAILNPMGEKFKHISDSNARTIS
jgi:hypothetical protein